MNIDQLKRVAEKPWFYPLLLFVIGFATYEYALTSLGYYWADWEIVMFFKLNPALQFDFYAHDRPFPWTYQLIHSLVGSAPMGWHIATLLIRWAGTLFFVQAMILVWPRYKIHLLWLGALLLVYPGFLQQPQSATKARHIMTMLLFALSIYLMALAVRRPAWARFLFPLSWLLTFVHLFTTEYFSAVEAVRPILLWLLMEGGFKLDTRLLRRVAVTSIPYILILLFFFWCRFIYFPVVFETTSRIGDINDTMGEFQTSFTGSLFDLFNRVLIDLFYSTVLVWTNSILNFVGFSFQSRVAWLGFGLGGVLAAVFAWFHTPHEQEAPDTSSIRSIFIVGLLVFLLGALPAWAIGKEVTTGGWNDRFALAPMFGAGLMLIALVNWLVRPAAQKWVFAFLLMFSIAAQVWNVNVYRRDWETQLNYYWQLHWRAPALQAGTAIFSLEQPSPSVTHYSDAGYAINVLYHYQTEDGTLPYWYFSRRFHFEYRPEMPIKYELRTLKFLGNTSDAVGVFHPTSACLRVLDPIYLDDPLYTAGQQILMPVSNLSRILPEPVDGPPDPDIFGPEPEHTWCYYFQKADLARQQQDWTTIIDLHQQTQSQGFTPNHGAEYLPFIEAYAQTGDWDKAYELTMEARKTTAGIKKMLCTNWARLSELPSADANVLQQVEQTFVCSGE
jgi:hypothetical protein